jgi:hypothetical protein
MSERTSFSPSMCQAEAWLFFLRAIPVHREEIGFLPKTLGQAREAERDVEVLGGAHDELAALALEEGIQVGAVDQARPRLRPAVAEPVRRD